MTALLLLIACFSLGVLVARFARPPPGLAQGINWWVIYVALPALVLELIPRLEVDPQLWFLVAAMWIVFLGAWALAALAGRALGWSRARIGGVVLAGGLSNTAFTGYPLIEALHGKEGLALAVVTDQLGCSIVLATGGVFVASLYSGGGKPSWDMLLRRVLLFPAFLALIAGLIAGAFGGWAAALDNVFARVGSTLTPLALFSIGLQFRLQLNRSQLGAAALALSWKLTLAPLAVYLVGYVSGIGGLTLTVGVLQAAMAPMISSAILSEQNRLEPEVANMALGAGIVISLVTVPLIDRLLT
jgi:malate permease and related proteins